MTPYADDITIRVLEDQLAHPDNFAHRIGNDDPLHGVRGILADALDENGREQEAQHLRTPGLHVVQHHHSGQWVPGAFTTRMLGRYHAALEQEMEDPGTDFGLWDQSGTLPEGVNVPYGHALVDHPDFNEEIVPMHALGPHLADLYENEASARQGGGPVRGRLAGMIENLRHVPFEVAADHPDAYRPRTVQNRRDDSFGGDNSERPFREEDPDSLLSRYSNEDHMTPYDCGMTEYEHMQDLHGCLSTLAEQLQRMQAPTTYCPSFMGHPVGAFGPTTEQEVPFLDQQWPQPYSEGEGVTDYADYNLEEQRAFEQQIDNNPQDSALRRVYADWLREHGQHQMADAEHSLGVMGGMDWGASPPIGPGRMFPDRDAYDGAMTNLLRGVGIRRVNGVDGAIDPPTRMTDPEEYAHYAYYEDDGLDYAFPKMGRWKSRPEQHEYTNPGASPGFGFGALPPPYEVVGGGRPEEDEYDDRVFWGNPHHQIPRQNRTADPTVGLFAGQGYVPWMDTQHGGVSVAQPGQPRSPYPPAHERAIGIGWTPETDEHQYPALEHGMDTQDLGNALPVDPHAAPGRTEGHDPAFPGYSSGLYTPESWGDWYRRLLVDNTGKRGESTPTPSAPAPQQNWFSTQQGNATPRIKPDQNARYAYYEDDDGPWYYYEDEYPLGYEDDPDDDDQYSPEDRARMDAPRTQADRDRQIDTDDRNAAQDELNARRKRRTPPSPGAQYAQYDGMDDAFSGPSFEEMRLGAGVNAGHVSGNTATWQEFGSPWISSAGLPRRGGPETMQMPTQAARYDLLPTNTFGFLMRGGDVGTPGLHLGGGSDSDDEYDDDESDYCSYADDTHPYGDMAHRAGGWMGDTAAPFLHKWGGDIQQGISKARDWYNGSGEGRGGFMDWANSTAQKAGGYGGIRGLATKHSTAHIPGAPGFGKSMWWPSYSARYAMFDGSSAGDGQSGGGTNIPLESPQERHHGPNGYGSHEPAHGDDQAAYDDVGDSMAYAYYYDEEGDVGGGGEFEGPDRDYWRMRTPYRGYL